MSFLGNLSKVGHGVAAQLNPFDGGQTYGSVQKQPSRAMGAPVGQLPQPMQLKPMMEYKQLMGPNGQPTGQFPGAPDVPMGQDPANYGYPPEITVDPTGRTPYSARTMELAQLGNQYTADPTNSRFIGVDPKIFGYPPDTSAQPQYSDPLNALRALLGL